MKDVPPTTAELLVEQFAPAVLLTLKQVAQVTGQAEQTLRNLISEGRTTLPSRKVGGKRVVYMLDLAEWLEQQRVHGEREVPPEAGEVALGQAQEERKAPGALMPIATVRPRCGRSTSGNAIPVSGELRGAASGGRRTADRLRS